jgi:hypothetical protein
MLVFCIDQYKIVTLFDHQCPPTTTTTTKTIFAGLFLKRRTFQKWFFHPFLFCGERGEESSLSYFSLFMGSVVLLYVKFEWTSTTEVFLTVL